MTDEKKLNIAGIGKGIVFSLILTFVLILIIAAVCYFATVSDRLLSVLVFAATGISVLLGAVFVARNAEGSGFLHGAVLGIGYILIMLLSNIISQKGFKMDSQLLTMLVCVLACGMLGGILGINAKN
jgi:putative membrane protein (TIGR04086 family)